MKKIAIIGTGIMGHGMAVNFLKKGYEVYVWNRSKEKIADLLELGAVEALTPREAAQSAHIVFEVTANDESSKSVWLGDSGILAGAAVDTVLVASATLSVDWVDQLALECQKRSMHFFDMPLTGGRSGAESGSLIFLVGGNANELENLRPILGAVSTQILYFGKAGNGMRFKLILNTLQAIHLNAFAEMMAIAAGQGLDKEAVSAALAQRPGGLVTQLASKAYDYVPDQVSFSVQWITKDLRYTKQLAKGLHVPFLNDALEKFEEAMHKGMAEKDWTNVMRL